jgi:hypothetical protein
MLTDVVRGLPLESNLQIVVLVDQVYEPIKQVLALFGCEAVDMLHMSAHGEDTLPAGDRVGANDGVNSLELNPNILRSAAGFLIELKTSSLRGLVEAWLGKCSCEGLQELLVRLADPVIDLIS